MSQRKKGYYMGIWELYGFGAVSSKEETSWDS